MPAVSSKDGTTIPAPVPPGLSSMTRAQLIDMIQEMAEDFQKLNGWYNYRADEHHWCGTYELRQETYNRHLKQFKLRGRATGLRVIPPRASDGYEGYNIRDALANGSGL